MKNIGYILLGCAMWFAEMTTLLLICVNIVLPVLLTIYTKSGWWICLYILEPVLMALYVWLDETFEDM